MRAMTCPWTATPTRIALGQHTHGTQGWGDTIFGPELRLADGPGYHLQINPMVSAPTGSVDKQMDGVFTHYGMQPGSGTWDFVPSITYTGRADRMTWGAQLLGIVRLEDENESGYRLGDVFQATAWGSYRFANGSRPHCAASTPSRV